MVFITPRTTTLINFLLCVSFYEESCIFLNTHIYTYIPWRRKWPPTLVFLPGESYGQRSLAGYHPSIGLHRCGYDWSDLEHIHTHKGVHVQKGSWWGCHLCNINISMHWMQVITELQPRNAFPAEPRLKGCWQRHWKPIISTPYKLPFLSHCYLLSGSSPASSAKYALVI